MTRYTPLWLQSGSYAASVDRRLIQALWPAARCSGGAVTPTGSGMALQAAPGQVAIPTANATGTVLCAWDAPETVTLDPAPPSGTNRIDLVVCQARGNDLDGGVNNDFVITFAKGADGGAAPAVPANAVALAQVTVPGGAGSIVAGNITDARPGSLSVPPAGFPPARMAATLGTNTIARIQWVTPIVWTVIENIGPAGPPNFAGGVWTVPATGRYRLSSSVMWVVPSTATSYQCQVQWTTQAGPGNPAPFGGMNAGMYHVMTPISIACNLAASGAAIVRPLSAGDTVGIQLYQSHPSASMQTLAGYTGMEIERVS